MQFSICNLLLLTLSTAGAAGAAEKPGALAAAAGANEAAKAERFAKLRRVLRSEPTILEVQHAAEKFYMLEPDHIRRMAMAAQAKGIVPEITGQFNDTLGNQYTNTKDGLYPILPSPASDPNPNNYREQVAETSGQLYWGLSATWYLDRLVFNPEQLDVISLDSLEENLVREVTTLFFARRRLLANLFLSPPETDEEELNQEMRLEEMTATLDAFTGGHFAERAWKGALLP